MRNDCDHDSILREVLAELADVPPPPGLAATAIRTARRRHQARVALVSVAATAAVLVAAPMVVSSVRTGVPAAAPSIEPLVITAYSLGWEESLLLDRDTGRYAQVPYRSVAPSPDGRHALVYAGDNGTRGPVRVGVLDTGTGEVRWMEGYVGAAGESPGGWSPDGEQLVITQRYPELSGGSGPSGFAIVDPDTLATRLVPHPDVDDPAINALGFRYVWVPGGDELALTQSIGTVADESDAVSAIRFYDLAGNLTRTVPATAPLTSEAGFSPDGTRIALQHPFLGEPIQVVDAVTGQLRQVVSRPSAMLVGWADEDHLMVRTTGTLQVVTLTGEVTGEVPLQQPAPSEVHVGASAGLPPDAGELTFGTR